MSDGLHTCVVGNTNLQACTSVSQVLFFSVFDSVCSFFLHVCFFSRDIIAGGPLALLYATGPACSAPFCSVLT